MTKKKINPKVIEARELLDGLVLTSKQLSHNIYSKAAVLSLESCLENYHSTSLIVEVFNHLHNYSRKELVQQYKRAVKECAGVDILRDSDGIANAKKNIDCWTEICLTGFKDMRFEVLKESGLKAFHKPIPRPEKIKVNNLQLLKNVPKKYPVILGYEIKSLSSLHVDSEMGVLKINKKKNKGEEIYCFLSRIELYKMSLLTIEGLIHLGALYSAQQVTDPIFQS